MRKYFLGGNTSEGFFSYYDYLIRQSEAQKIYVIKGGPGTGKSTIMKKVGEWAAEAGFETDYIYCSSDPDSLDGLVVPEMKIAMVDGTAPHIVDPKNPGAVDTIVHLGDCWNESKMKKNKADIINTNSKIKEKFRLSYEHLKAAGTLYSAKNKIYEKIVKHEELAKAQTEIIHSEIKGYSSCGTAWRRKLFASSYGPKGYICHAETIGCEKKYVLRGFAAPMITKKITDVLGEYGYDTELFYNPLAPSEEIAHIYVPELQLGIFTEDLFSGISTDGAEIIDTRNAADQYLFDEYADEIDNLNRAVNRQTDEACKIIASAKSLHDKLEGYYIPNMDFAAIGRRCEKIIKELEAMI